MAGGYLAKYGDSLRRLAALEAGMTGEGPVLPSGPQPMTGAFEVTSALNPKYEPAPVLPQAQAPAAQPAFAAAEQAAPAQAPAGGAFDRAEQEAKPKVTVGDVFSTMGEDERQQVAAAIEEKSGKTVDQLYDEMVKAGEIAPPAKKKPPRSEKLPRIAEALLRFAVNMSRTGNAGAASAMATLETEQHRGALEQAEIDRANQEQEQRRAEVASVLAARKGRAEKKEDTESERRYKDEDREDAQRHALELQRAQDAAAKLREKGRNVAVVTEVDGTVNLVDKDTGEAIPVTTIKDVTRSGTRGRRITTKERVPLKTSTKRSYDELTPQERQRAIAAEVKRLSEDRALMRRLKTEIGDDPAAIQRRLHEMAGQALDSSTSASEYGENPLD